MLLVAVIFPYVLFCVLSIRPNNLLSENDLKKMSPKKMGRFAFCGFMITALILVALWLCGIRNEVVPMFVGIPDAIIIAALIQLSIPNK